MPSIVYSELAYCKIQTWVHLAKGEVSGMGLVRRDPDDTLYVYDAFLIEQDCTGTNTELRPAALAQFTEQMFREGKYDDVRLWWHSHANMDVFWSGTDEACIKSIGGSEYLLSTVFNKKGKQKSRIDVFNPFQMTLDNLPIKIGMLAPDIQADCEAQFKEKVNHKTSTVIYSNKSYGHGYPKGTYKGTKTYGKNRIKKDDSKKIGYTPTKEDKELIKKQKRTRSNNVIPLDKSSEESVYLDDDNSEYFDPDMYLDSDLAKIYAEDPAMSDYFNSMKEDNE